LSGGFLRSRSVPEGTSKLFKREGAEEEEERIKLEIGLPGKVCVTDY
jgi:hypothetical protein